MTVFDIDSSAPVSGVAEALIPAPRGLVWRLLSDVAAWPAWNPAVEGAWIAGAAVPGTEFEWRAAGRFVRARLEVVDAPARIGWTGRAPGLRARRVVDLEEAAGGTRVWCRESLSGVLPVLFRARSRAALDAALSDGLAALARAAEARPAPRAA